MLAFTVNFPTLSPSQANATFQQRFRAAVARAARVATDAVAITLASPGVVISAAASPGVTLGTEVTFPESDSTAQADDFGGELASGGSSAIVEAGEDETSPFQKMLAPLQRHLSSFLAHALSKKKMAKTHSHSLSKKTKEPLINTLTTQDPGIVSAYGPLAVSAVAPAAIVPSPVRCRTLALFFFSSSFRPLDLLSHAASSPLPPPPLSLSPLLPPLPPPSPSPVTAEPDPSPFPHLPLRPPGLLRARRAGAALRVPLRQGLADGGDAGPLGLQVLRRLFRGDARPHARGLSEYVSFGVEQECFVSYEGERRERAREEENRGRSLFSKSQKKTLPLFYATAPAAPSTSSGSKLLQIFRQFKSLR